MYLTYTRSLNIFSRHTLKNGSLLLLWLLLLPLFTTPLPSIGLNSTIGINNIQPFLLNKANINPAEKVSIIVQKQTQNHTIEDNVTALGGSITKDLHIINAFVATLPVGKVVELGKSTGVRWISYDAPASSSSCSGCGDVSKLVNNYDKEVNATKLWNQTTNGTQQPWLQGQGVTVATIDSGIVQKNDFKDADTKSDRVLTAVSTQSGVDTKDHYGHGSHVAGIIAGSGLDSSGQYVGIAPKVNLVSVKVSDNQGNVSSSDIVNGLQWINDNKDTYNIKVINLSVNSDVAQSYNQDPIDAAVEILWFNKVVVVVSAGNNGNSTLYAPANDPFVITVGAIDDAGTLGYSDDKVTSYSAYGTDETGNAKPDIVAPGRKIVSVLASGGDVLAKAYPQYRLSDGLAGSYMIMSGTSMAAPMVSGAAALLLQSEPNLNPDQVKYRLKATALQDKPRASWDTRTASWPNYSAINAGAGYLDINAAVSQKTITNTANTGTTASRLLWSGNTPVNWSSASWTSVHWTSVHWTSTNWSSVHWTSVHWTDYWGD